MLGTSNESQVLCLSDLEQVLWISLSLDVLIHKMGTLGRLPLPGPLKPASGIGCVPPESERPSCPCPSCGTSLQGDRAEWAGEDQMQPISYFPDSLFHGSQRRKYSCLFNGGKNEFIFIP